MLEFNEKINVSIKGLYENKSAKSKNNIDFYYRNNKIASKMMKSVAWNSVKKYYIKNEMLQYNKMFG